MDFPANIIDVPTFGGDLGSLGVLESNLSTPFQIKRVYFIHHVPDGVSRGAHGHKRLEQLIVPLSGSFEVSLDNGFIKKSFKLDNPRKGLHLQPGLWRNLSNFSEGAVCLVLASELFEESDYIRDYKEFLAWATK